VGRQIGHLHGHATGQALVDLVKPPS
jgi:hypothetical protein